MIDAQNEIACNVALHELADAITDQNTDQVAEQILSTRTVTFERDVNDAGVAVRRTVMRGEWHVDPELATRLSGSMRIVENDRERIGADAVRDALNDLFTELSDGPRVWTERALDGVRLDRVQLAIRRACDRLGLQS